MVSDLTEVVLRARDHLEVVGYMYIGCMRPERVLPVGLDEERIGNWW